MKKLLLTGAILLSSLFSATAQVTITVADENGDPLSFTAADFTQLSEAGAFTGTLTSIDYDVVLEASTEETYANDLTILVATGLAAGNEYILQAGGFSNFGFDEHIEGTTGASEAVGTAWQETLTLAAPIDFTANPNYLLFLGNGYVATSQANMGTWSGTITLNGISAATAGLNTVLTSQFSVYPNPATDLINVSNADNILVTGVSIVDLNGRTVKTVSLDNVAEAQINVADLAAGMYIMNITSDIGTATKKIVKN